LHGKTRHDEALGVCFELLFVQVNLKLELKLFERATSARGNGLTSGS
jgi:hypothetical protein